MLPFAVVDFLDGGGVAILPCKWFTGPEEDTCYWPPGRLNISKAVKDEIPPNPTWPQFKVRVLGKAGNVAFFFMVTSNNNMHVSNNISKVCF